MKILGGVLFLVLLGASTGFAQGVTVSGGTITTSKSTLTLPPLEGLTSENSLRQANSIVEIALGELAADGAALDQEEKTLVAEVAAYDKKKKEEQALLDDPTGPYMIALEKYRPKLADHEKRKADHNADAAKQRGEVAASNSLAPEQRDAVNVSRLNTWGNEISNRKEMLDKERDSLLDEYTSIKKFEDDANARLKAIADPLKARISTLNAKQGLAYRQLKQCAAYATEIREILKTKYNQANASSPLLDSAAERLKALSARGFDTP